MIKTKDKKKERIFPGKTCSGGEILDDCLFPETFLNSHKLLLSLIELKMQNAKRTMNE